MAFSRTPRKRHGVVAVIVREGKLLVIQRSQWVRAPLAWCFPGGGVEENETEEQALVREVHEELDIITTPLKLLWKSGTPGKLDLSWWLTDMPEDAILRPHPDEVAEVQWLAPSELDEIEELLPSNVEFLQAWRDGVFEIEGIELDV